MADRIYLCFTHFYHYGRIVYMDDELDCVMICLIPEEVITVNSVQFLHTRFDLVINNDWSESGGNDRVNFDYNHRCTAKRHIRQS